MLVVSSFHRGLSSHLLLNLTRNCSLIPEPFSTPRKRSKSDVVLSVAQVINKIPSCFSTVRKEDSRNQGARGVERPPSKDLSRDWESSLTLSQPVFFPVKWFTCWDKWAQTAKALSWASRWVGGFCFFVFQFHVSFPGNRSTGFSIPDEGFPHLVYMPWGGGVIISRKHWLFLVLFIFLKLPCVFYSSRLSIL